MDLVPIFIILASLLLLAFVLLYAYYLSKKVTKFSQQETEIYKQSDQVMEQALKKAERVLKEAVDKAKRMLSQTDYFQREIERESRNAFLQTSHRYVELFEQDLKKLSESYKNLFVQLEEKAVGEMKVAVEDQKITTKLYLQKRIDEEYERAKKEIEDYKQSQLENIQGSVDKIVQKVAKDVLRQSLPVQDQKELLIKALEKAKAEGLFENE